MFAPTLRTVLRRLFWLQLIGNPPRPDLISLRIQRLYTNAGFLMSLKREKILQKEGRPSPLATKPTRKKLGRPTLSTEALLDKALDVFLELGFEGATVDAITAAAGVAKRTVYLRYSDKTTLFKAALERAINAWIVPVERLRAEETADFEETLLRIGQLLLTNIMRPSGIKLLRIANAESARMPEISAYSNQMGTEPTLRYLEDLLGRRIKVARDEARNFGEAALAFLHLIVGGPACLTAWGVVLDKAEIDKHTRYCVQLFLHGLVSQTPPGVTPVGLAAPSGTTGEGMNNAVESQAAAQLARENSKLRTLLVEAMLEVATLKEQT